ncbi:TPA: sugar transferase, partial [Campylobacter coli]|nr:sugar transferase [Campylobacter coli]
MTFLNNSKTFIDYIKLPFLLFNVSRQHKKERKEFETQADIHNVSLILPPLEECLDYKEVLKIKNELPYKIGISLIKANREWYKG